MKIPIHYQLPDATRVFLCHDYLTEHREHFVCETDIQIQKQHNIHIHTSTGKAILLKCASSGMPN